MPVDLNAFPDLSHLSFRIDQESTALNPHRFFAVHVLFAVRPKLLGHREIGIGKQRKIERVLIAKLRMTLAAVTADTDHRRAQARKLLARIPKGTSFFGAPRRVVLG